MIDVVGRGPEISRVVRWFRSDGPPTLVIDGPAGAGKTTVLAAAVDSVRATGARLIASSPTEAESRLSYSGLADLLGAHLLAIRSSLPPADMVVPAGKYHVTARGTVNNQTGTPVAYVACNAYGGGIFIDSGTTSAPLQYAGFAIDGTVDLAAGGTIRVECISSVAGSPLPVVGISLVAVSVAGITALP